jgi:hypothetical protein
METYETKCKSPQGGIEKKLYKFNISLIDPKNRKQLELELELKEIRKQDFQKI